MMIIRHILRSHSFPSAVRAVSTAENVQKKTTVNLYGGNWPESFVALNNLHDNPGATKQKRRVGRGTGSGRGKTCGRGQKGQKARSGKKPRLLFAGGQTPLSRAFPKKGFHNPNRVIWTVLNLEHLSACIENGKIKTDEIITMKTLRDTGVLGKKIRDGVKVLARGADTFRHQVHMQVSKCSIKAEQAIERNGGTVRLVYYEDEGLRALLKPHRYVKKGWMIPSPARHIPAKNANAYDFAGETEPKTQLDANTEHFETPKRKQPDHPGLPPGTGPIKNRYRSTIVIDYGRKGRLIEMERAKQEEQPSTD